MKWFFRWALRLFLLLVVLVVAVVLFRDAIARKVAEYVIGNRTGLRTAVGRAHIGLRHPELAIENLVIYNSAEFGGTPLIELRELYVAYDQNDYQANKLHCTLLRFNLAQVNLVEDKQGRNNIQVMEQHLEKAGEFFTFGKQREHKHDHKAPLEFSGIDRLELTLGSASYVRLKLPEQKVELRMQVDHQVFKDIKSEDDLSGVMFVALLRSKANILQSGGVNWLQWLAPLHGTNGS